ncbi:aromatic-ring-hydroxylating dioxygenase subunit beta [Pseudorhodoferax sp.]|uniref:aromatic-ring-hydroxylating dioxygenase subunit beta n=1 Tax=Pseudorhodoferax sp. TaxID=1993553 RepID=UPI002DD68D70|nr:aromatic-ring-hydroxylating dioxygenase subunit beta [Pseudorhodoferax sp.]
MASAEITERLLIDFVVHEAMLLDENRLDEWDALFTTDGWYWLPAAAHHDDPLLQASHLYDDALLRRVKLQRLQNPRAHSQQPPGQGHHLLQTPVVTAFDTTANHFALRTPFIYTELRAGRTTVLPGTAHHHLVATPQGLRMRLKRVDLLHAAEALPAIEFYV